MNDIDKILHHYKGEVLLRPAYKGKKDRTISEAIYSILYISNGILETMLIPASNKKIEIAWIIYPHEMILEWTTFYAANYNIKGTVFSDDGAGSPFIIKPDGTITCFNCIDNEETKIAASLSDFFQ